MTGDVCERRLRGVTVFKNFKEAKPMKPPFAAEGIFGGALVAIRSNEFVDFYDWDDLRLVRRIGTASFFV